MVCGSKWRFLRVIDHQPDIGPLWPLPTSQTSAFLQSYWAPSAADEGSLCVCVCVGVRRRGQEGLQVSDTEQVGADVIKESQCNLKLHSSTVCDPISRRKTLVTAFGMKLKNNCIFHCSELFFMDIKNSSCSLANYSTVTVPWGMLTWTQVALQMKPCKTVLLHTHVDTPRTEGRYLREHMLTMYSVHGTEWRTLQRHEDVI